MAADAAHLAGLGTGPSGSASGHRAHRRLRAQQGGAASDALDGRVPGLAAAQVLVEARHDLDEIAGTVAVAELVHQDLVPGIAAGARRARQAEDVGAAGNSGGRANGAILAQDSALLLLAGLMSLIGPRRDRSLSVLFGRHGVMKPVGRVCVNMRTK